MNKFMTLSAAAVAITAFVLAGPVHAQLEKADQGCRVMIAKGLTKLAKTADKTIGKCHKKRNIGKIDPLVNCNNLAEADPKGKMAKAETKLKDGIAKKCVDATAGFATAAQLTPASAIDYISCPEACGVPNPLTSYTDLGDCLACYGGSVTEALALVNLANPVPELGKDDAKCHSGIAKGYGKYTATILKERTKCQKGNDKDVGSGDITACAIADPKLKIAKALVKAEAGLDKFCAVADLNNVASCSSASLVDLKSCLKSNADATAASLFASNYELPATICPGGLATTIQAGAGPGGSVTRTALKVGHTGIGHEGDLPDGYGLDVLSTCDPGAAPPACGDCSLDGVDSVGAAYAVRCAGDSARPCSNPFGIDPVCPFVSTDGGGNRCTVYLGPPLPLSAGNVPVCVLNSLREDLSGSGNVESGSAELAINLRSKVHTGLLTVQPCPLCVGDTTANDGIAGGVCQDGRNNGGSCDIHAVDATFGDMSLDCPPSLSANISGNGLLIDLGLTTGLSSMPFGVKCSSPIPTFDCACAVCTGDQTLACNSDAECAAVGAGTCASSGGGVPRLPNACADGICTPDGSGGGECLAGPFDKFCDGALKANGGGILGCVTDADCRPLDPVCQGGNCGNCTIEPLRSCYLDPITDTGIADPSDPVLVSTFCVPPTSKLSVDSSTGLPGPALLNLDLLSEFKY